jgi:hypothetical protein
MHDPIWAIKHSYTLVAISIIFTSKLCSQQYVDIARITQSQTPTNTFDSSLTSTFVRETMADITYPIELSDSLAIITGFLYENLYAKTSEFSTSYTSVHGITLKAGLNIQHNSKLKGSYVFMPKLSSDLKKIGSTDFQFGGSILPHFLWQFGGYYNSELFGPFFVPFLGCYYKSPNGKFETNVLLPASVDMNFGITSKLKVGGSFVSFVKSFHLNESIGSSGSSYWNKSTNEIFGYLQLEPKSGFIFQARAGYSIARRFSLYKENDKIDWGIMAFKFGDDRTRQNQWFADGAIFQLRFIYRYYFK